MRTGVIRIHRCTWFSYFSWSLKLNTKVIKRLSLAGIVHMSVWAREGGVNQVEEWRPVRGGCGGGSRLIVVVGEAWVTCCRYGEKGWALTGIGRKERRDEAQPEVGWEFWVCCVEGDQGDWIRVVVVGRCGLGGSEMDWRGKARG